MSKILIHKKDTVVVLSGRDRGKKGEVLKVFPGFGDVSSKVLVSKVNIVTAHKKPRQSEPGGIQKKESPLAMSKVRLLCPKCQKPIRPKLDKLATGERVRICRKCSEVIL